MDVIHIDQNIIVVNKPPGLATVPGGWNNDAESLKEVLEKEAGRLWIVHRIDKGTSGTVLFARTPEAHRLLSILFEKGEVNKTYQAILCGIPEWEKLEVNYPLRSSAGRRHRTVVDQIRGKPAVTCFHVIEHFSSNTYIEAMPRTGRTHQIRAHAAAIGHPLLADSLYGAAGTEVIARPALHARSLELVFNGTHYQFISPCPEDFSKAINQLRACS